MGSLNRFLHPLVQSSIGMRLGGAISGVAATLTLVAAATPRYMSVCNVSLLQPPGSHELQISQYEYERLLMFLGKRSRHARAPLRLELNLTDT